MALRIIKGGVIKGADTPIPEERVGYKNPPRETRFKKGQSGNPYGRPKKKKEPPTTARGYAAEALSHEATVVFDGKPTKATLIKVATMKLAQKAAQGDRLSLQLLLNMLSGEPLPFPKSYKKDEMTAREMLEEMTRWLVRGGVFKLGRKDDQWS